MSNDYDYSDDDQGYSPNAPLPDWLKRAMAQKDMPISGDDRQPQPAGPQAPTGPDGYPVPGSAVGAPPSSAIFHLTTYHARGQTTVSSGPLNEPRLPISRWGLLSRLFRK
jgi:hypothetical protein